MQIDLIRHGECNDEAFLRGSRTDSALSQKGIIQLSQVFQNEYLNKQHHSLSNLLIYSPLKRCASFSEQLSHQPEWQNVITLEMDNIKERDFGEWDGLTYNHLEQHHSTELANYLDHPFDYPIPQAESLGVFEKRIDQAWSNILNIAIEHSKQQANTKSEQRIVVLTHGGVIRVLLKQVLGLTNEKLFQWQIGYGARLSLQVHQTNQGMFVQIKELVQLDNEVGHSL